MIKRPEKNSERVEIRLPYSLKQQFLAACTRAGETPSDVLREAMADYVTRVELAEKPTPLQEIIMKLIHNPLKAAGMTLASVTAFALMAAPSSADERLFNALDLDEDGAISALDLSEADRIVIQVLDADGSETITLDEFRILTRYGQIITTGDIGVVADTVTVNSDDASINFDGDVHAQETEDGGFKLILPEGTDWQPDLSTLSSGDSVTGKIKVTYDTYAAQIVTLDLSQAGKVIRTTTQADPDDLTEEELKLIVLEQAAAQPLP